MFDGDAILLSWRAVGIPEARILKRLYRAAASDRVCAEEMLSDTPQQEAPCAGSDLAVVLGMSQSVSCFWQLHCSEYTLSSSFISALQWELACKGEATPCTSGNGLFLRKSPSNAILGAIELNPAPWKPAIVLGRKGGALSPLSGSLIQSAWGHRDVLGASVTKPRNCSWCPS